MKIKKVFESKLLTKKDSDVQDILFIIEDSLIDINPVINIDIYTDCDLNNNESEFTSSVGFRIIFNNKQKLSISQGNPNSHRPIDVENILLEYTEIVKINTLMQNSIKSLIYRLSKSKYPINYISYKTENGENSLNIFFIVNDERISK